MTNIMNINSVKELKLSKQQMSWLRRQFAWNVCWAWDGYCSYVESKELNIQLLYDKGDSTYKIVTWEDGECESY